MGTSSKLRNMNELGLRNRPWRFHVIGSTGVVATVGYYSQSVASSST